MFSDELKFWFHDCDIPLYAAVYWSELTHVFGVADCQLHRYTNKQIRRQ